MRDQFVSFDRQGRELKGRVTDVDGDGQLTVRVYDKRADGGWEKTRQTVTVHSDDAKAITPLPTKGARGSGKSAETRQLGMKVIETRAPGDSETGRAQVWLRVNDYTITDTYGTRFAIGFAKRYLDSHPNRPTLLFGHGYSGGIHSVLGHGVDWREDATGLDILFELDDFDAVPTARQAFAQLESGTFDSCSVGFIRRADQYVESDDGDYVSITDADLPEVSIVVEASNPGTKVLALAGARGPLAERVAQIMTRQATGETDLTSALSELRDVLAHPDGDTGDQTWVQISELASNVDAAVDAIRVELENPTAPDGAQAMALVSLAEASCDALLDALGVEDPDDADVDDDNGAQQGAYVETQGRSKSAKAVTCPTCKGEGAILEGKRKCPMCKGDKKVLPVTAAKHYLKGRSDSVETGDNDTGLNAPNDDERAANEAAAIAAQADADAALALING